VAKNTYVLDVNKGWLKKIQNLMRIQKKCLKHHKKLFKLTFSFNQRSIDPFKTQLMSIKKMLQASTIPVTEKRFVKP
jgi:hypothetical protein